MGLMGNPYDDMVVSLDVLKADGDNESINTTGVDMLGYQGVMFLVAIGKGEVAACTIKAQRDTDAAFGTAADILGTSTACATAVATDGKAILVVEEPGERYVRAVVTVPNITTPVPVTVFAIKYGPKNKPVTNMAGEFHFAKAEGTA